MSHYRYRYGIPEEDLKFSINLSLKIIRIGELKEQV
jgi:hypothetical protein